MQEGKIPEGGKESEKERKNLHPCTHAPRKAYLAENINEIPDSPVGKLLWKKGGID